MKKIWESKTVWIAVAQGVVGVIVAIISEDPTLKGAGFLAIVKSFIDMWVRLNTDKAIKV